MKCFGHRLGHLQIVVAILKGVDPLTKRDLQIAVAKILESKVTNLTIWLDMELHGEVKSNTSGRCS